MRVQHLLLVAARFLLAAVAVATASAAAANTWQVTSHGDDPSDATTLRGALRVARDGDTIDLTGLTGSIDLVWQGAQILTELPVIYSVTIKGPGPDKLAIDGKGYSTVFHVFSGAETTISGVTIRNGAATPLPSPSGFAVGGGVNNSGTLTLTDCAVTGNTAAGSGGGGFGGGIFNHGSRTLTITRCTLSGNVAIAGNSVQGEGGAIFNDANAFSGIGSVAIDNSTISGNTANLGGGIFSFGTLTITNSTLNANTAVASNYPGDSADGGAVVNINGSVTLSGVTVSNNVAASCAGVSNATEDSDAGGIADVIGSTFSNNGSEALCNEGTLSATNTTITGNKGAAVTSFTRLGGFGIEKASFVGLVNVTVAGNGMGLSNAGLSDTYLANTILAGNASGNCFNSSPATYTIVSGDHNVSNDTTCAVFLGQPNDFAPHTDPGLDPGGLKDNGGPTKTIALTFGSVAVDAIPPAACAVSVDQRGVSRPQGTNCDIGAYEATPDFDFSPIAAISATVGSSGSTNVRVISFVGFQSAVTLTASNSPAGIGASFSPNPVTPPSYGSASSNLTVNVGPAVTPATYSLGVNGSSGSLLHSTSVKVIVGVTTAGITQVVDIEQALGCIDNAGVANAVNTYLAQAQADIDAGDAQDAKSVLNNLLALLQAQRGKHIHTSCTINNVAFDPDAVLIADVQALLATL